MYFLYKNEYKIKDLMKLLQEGNKGRKKENRGDELTGVML
jgi:hypothetical protein